jgi:hypothetical protein
LAFFIILWKCVINTFSFWWEGDWNFMIVWDQSWGNCYGIKYFVLSCFHLLGSMIVGGFWGGLLSFWRDRKPLVFLFILEGWQVCISYWGSEVFILIYSFLSSWMTICIWRFFFFSVVMYCLLLSSYVTWCDLVILKARYFW